MLPGDLPVDDRLSFDAAYLPGTHGAAVGGDWYDAFRLPDGRIAFSIGDVEGEDVTTAIVMGEVRQAFRAVAKDAQSPSLVLERANALVASRPEPVMVTAIFGIIEPRDGTITYACAGHPAPILALPGGSVALLPKDGLPLGVAADVGANDWTFTLPPGARFALYTDGLMEHSREAIAREARLMDALRGAPAGALLQISAHDVDSPSFTFTFTALPMGVPLVRRALERYVGQFDLDEEARFAVLTAAGEAIANAVEHAYRDNPGLVRVRGEALGDRLILTVEDEGTWKPARRVSVERGRGLPLMRALMDAVEVRTHPARTEVRLTKALQERASA